MIDRRDEFDRLKVPTTHQNDIAVKDADVVILAIKPQTFDTVLTGLKSHIPSSTLVVSIIAGTPLSGKSIENVCVSLCVPSGNISTCTDTSS